MRKSTLAVAAVTMLVGILMSSAPGQAASEGPSEAILGFSPATPGAKTTVTVRVTYYHPDGRDVKPSPVKVARFELPEGTRLAVDKLPTCSASDTALRLLGRGACPADSAVAQGRVVGMTGLPAPGDLLTVDVIGYNTGDGIAMVAFLPNTPIVIAIDRTRIEDNVFTAYPPPLPGGPPDLRTVMRDVALEFPAYTGFVTTPADCPGDGTWDHHSVLSFEDGTTQTASGVIPCTD